MKTNIIKLIILTIIALLLCCILFLLLTKNNIGFIKIGSKGELLKEESYDISKTKIKINTYSADIEMKESKDEFIHIELYGEEETDYVIEDKEELKIEENKKRNICIGFCFVNKHIVVYLPNNYISELEVKTISGDVIAQRDFITKTEIDTTSGDVILKENKEIKINTVSGEIKLDNATSLDIGTTSGDIHIASLELESDSRIETVSGDVNIKKTNELYIDTNTVSGDVHIENNNRHAEIELKIKTTSGDIHIKN